MAVWSEHRGWGSEEGLEDALCGVLFNAQGMLHEALKVRHKASRGQDDHAIHTQLHRFAALKTKRDTLAARLDELDHTPCAWELPLAKSVKKGAKRP